MKKLLAVSIAVLTLLPAFAHAARVKSIRSFCAQSDCADGAQPWSVPVTDGAGNWYGTTGKGGAKQKGTIYRMTFDGTHWKYTRLYSFCTDRKCSDGSEPHGKLVLDSHGNLYGTASGGGENGGGTAFELTADGTFKKLHDFCSLKDCADGKQPIVGTLAYQGAGTLYDGKAPLFGTTATGGSKNGGTVYKLTPSHGAWSLKVIHHFCSDDMCKDGMVPYSGLLIDDAGNMYGSATGGGAYLHGTVFEMSPHGSGYSYTVLHHFCAAQDTNCVADGAEPLAAPIMDGMGNLYGTTFVGGAGLSPQGTVWKIVPNGAHSRLTKLHDFCMVDVCADGSNPFASLTLDGAGHLLGTTYFGGDMNAGIAFKLIGGSLKSFVKLVSFNTAAAPGGAPLGGLTADGTSFLGTTVLDATNGNGDFYRLTP